MGGWVDGGSRCGWKTSGPLGKEDKSSEGCAIKHKIT